MDVIKINKNDIFYRGKPDRFTITPEMKLAIQNLRYEKYDGGYVDNGLLWTTKNNLHIFEYCSDMESGLFLNIAIAMQFIVRSIKLADIDPEYVKEHDIKEYHIKLINRLYIDCDEYKEVAVHEIYTADKRPFGNSYMIGDIKEEMCEEDEDKDDYDKYNKIYHEVLDLALHTFKHMNIPFHSFVYVGDGDWDWGVKEEKITSLTSIQQEYYNHYWTINAGEYRDKRIDEIIND